MQLMGYSNPRTNCVFVIVSQFYTYDVVSCSSSNSNHVNILNV